LGSLCLHLRDITANRNHIAHQKKGFDHYLAQAIDEVDSSGRYNKLLVEVRQIRGEAPWVKAEGKVLLYLPGSGNVNYGDILLIRGEPQRIKPPLNPDEFDYQKYMQNKGIIFQHFIKGHDFVIIDQKPGSFIRRISIRARNRISSLITEHFKAKSTQGIMLALLTGQRNYIDQETYDNFIDIGIIHVLAVSGLHVGIIYMFLLVLFRPLYRNIWSRNLSLCLKIGVLLFFAFLTGLSPSVLRATLMFSIMITGKILNRNSHILNSVFLSACILLCINPYMIFDVGYQLSYSAVIGIIIFQPMIYKNLKFKIKAIDWIWQLTTVSIAAQLGTLPFSLFYFKQFPTYFLLGNIIAIPYVTISIIAGMILLIVFPIKFIASIVVWLLQFLTDLFLIIITKLQTLPLGKIYPIHINANQCILLVVLILSMFFMIRKRNWKIIFISLISASGIILADINQYVSLQKEKKIIIYHIPYRSCIELVDNMEGVMLVRNLSEDLRSKIQYHTANHIIKEKRETVMSDFPDFARKFASYSEDGILFFIWNGKSIAIVYGKYDIETLKLFPLDYLIVSGNILETDDFLKMHLDIKQTIWDASNSIDQSDYHKFLNNDVMHHVRINGPYMNSLRIK